MNRRSLRMLARERLKDARLLHRAGRYSGCYYLCGYVIECALKACIARQTERHDFPDKKFAIDIHTHNIERLLDLAELKVAFKEARNQDRSLADNWLIVLTWNESYRYDISSGIEDASGLLQAIIDPHHGVLTWIKKHW